MIKTYSLNFSEKPFQDQCNLVWAVLSSFSSVDVDNFINTHKDGWPSDAGLLARKLSLAKQSQQ